MQIEVPACDGKTICMKWENGFEIKCTAEGSAVVLSANQAGLVSLARHLLTLAQDGVPAHTHTTCLHAARVN
jgi:hypothetical protein